MQGLHYGYVQSEAMIKFKTDIHGDRGGWRTDIDWYNDRFLKFPQIKSDLHATERGMWNAVPYDKSQMPDFMRNHKYYNIDIVK